MMMSLFVSEEDLQILTGYTHASKQIARLRQMGIPFRINAANRPVVATSAIEGGKAAASERKKVVPAAFTQR